MSDKGFQKQTLDAMSPLKLTGSQLTGTMSIPSKLTGSIATNTAAKVGSSFLGGLGGKASSFMSGGMGDVMGVASGINNIFSAQGNTAQKQMQRGDAIVDTVSAGLSFIPGFGQAAGVALKLVNSIGGKFVKDPSFMKNYTTNQNVMQNASAFGGVAAGADNADATKGTFKNSGLFGKLIGKNNTSRKIFEKTTKQQSSTQGLLDENKIALDNANSSADMFNTRNQINQTQGNLFNRGGITFGQKGAKLIKVSDLQSMFPKKKPAGIMKNVLSVKLQTGGILPRKGISSDDKKYWNGFIDYLGNSGHKGDADLNNVDKNLSRNLWNEYGKTRGFVKNYEEFVPKVQAELKNYREESIKDMQSGKATLKGYTKDQVKSKSFDWDSVWMPDLSEVDGLAGTKTTSWKLPTRKQYVHTPTEIAKTEPFKEEVPATPVETVVDELDSQDSPSKHKNGGSIKNVIVGGELHARKHTLHDLEEYKDAKITKKGVPVVVKEDGGTIEQTAEVEREELILHIKLTKKIEELYEDGSDESAIEAGKLLSTELTQNLVDNSSVLEKIIQNEED